MNSQNLPISGKPKNPSRSSSKSTKSNGPKRNASTPKRPSPGLGARKPGKGSKTSKESAKSNNSKGSTKSRKSDGNKKGSKNMTQNSNDARSKQKESSQPQPKTFLEAKQEEESKLTEHERNEKRHKEVALIEKYKDGFVDQPPEVDDNAEELYLEMESLETTKYGIFLHYSLQWMWIVLNIFGRIPFRIKREDNDITFDRNRTSIDYMLALLNAFVLLVLFSWLTVGIVLMFIPTSRKVPRCDKLTQVLNDFEKMFVLRYMLEIFLLWTTLFHAMVSSVHLVCQEMKYASLFREWYVLSDRCQFRIYYGIRSFIIREYMILMVTLLVILVFYFAPIHARWFPPTVYKTCSIVGLCMVKLTSPFAYKIHDPKRREIVYDQYAWVGLLLYFVAIISSRLNLIPYMVSCRLLENTGNHFNKRINMALKNEPAEGDMAVRLRRNLLYQDHNAICYLAKKIGRVYNWSLVTYYILQVVSIMTALIVIGIHRYRDEYNHYKWNHLFKSTYEFLRNGDDSRHKFISHVGHLMLTATSFLYITYIAIHASDRCMIVYEIVRRYGLHRCQNEVERNFIRSMWMSGDSKRKIVISPGAFFDVGRPFIMALFTEIILYYVHILPFRSDLASYTGMDNLIRNFESYKNSSEFNSSACSLTN